MKKSTAGNWIHKLLNTDWLGLATLAGLYEAMDDIGYTYGVSDHESNRDRTLNITKEEKDYPIKLAA